jgi:hypothetical protein
MTKIGVIGARVRNSQTDFELVCEALVKITQQHPQFMLISGGCKKGADHFAEELAGGNDNHIRIHYPKVSSNMSKAQYRTACYDRNTLIAEDSDILLACVAPNRKGGTEDTIKKFLTKMGLPEWAAREQGLLYIV